MYAELFLKNRKEIGEASHVKAFAWMGKFDPTARSTREMTEVATKSSREGLAELLAPLGEPVPRTDEEMQQLLEKLDTPFFQSEIRASLNKPHEE